MEPKKKKKTSSENELTQVKYVNHDNTSFEHFLIKNKKPKLSFHSDKNCKHVRKTHFIDEIDKKNGRGIERDVADKTKPLEEVVDIESYKKFNVDVSEEPINTSCTCIIF